MSLPRTDEPIVIDGVLNDSAWAQSLRVELGYENDPGENTPAPVRTIALLMEDGENVYIAFDAHDPEPERIRAWLRDRDALGSSDFVGVSLDTFNDGRRAYEFFANPLGVQLDRIQDDVNNRDDSAWNAIWDSAGRIGESGYAVEMRIPLSQLRFQDTDADQVWGYRLLRSYPRDNGVSMSNMARDRDRNCEICQYPRFRGFAGAESGSNLEVVPTLTLGYLTESPNPGFAPLVNDGVDVEPGVGLRSAITPEFTANLALNPDFSQVESDSAILDVNNRFTPSFPEQRPFFLEGADFFQTPLNAVFTRTVGSPNVAAKLTGKRGANTLAAFVAQDEVTSLLFPGPTGSDATVLEQPNTAVVARYSRAFSGTSQLGGLLTVRDGDGYRNVVGGVDTRWRFSDRQELTAQLLRSQTRYPDAVAREFEQPATMLDGNAIRLRHEYDSRDWFASFEHWQIDRLFRADAGFMNQAGSRQQELSFGRRWHGDDTHAWTRMKLRGAYETKHQQDGRLLEETWIASLDVRGPFQSLLDVNLRSGRELDNGRYFDYERVDLGTRFQPFGGFELGFNSRFGKEVDFDNSRLADQLRFQPFLKWNVNRNLFLHVNGSKVELETPAGQQIFDASVIDTRLMWQFNLRSYLRLTFQQTEVDRNPDAYVDSVEQHSRDIGRQLMYSWKLNAQTVFFLGYADTYAHIADIGESRAADRRWFLKVGYAWAM